MSVCAKDGCPEKVTRGYCVEHRRRRARSPSSRVTGTAIWKRVRLRVLERDGWASHYCG